MHAIRKLENMSLTLVEKIWREHEIVEQSDGNSLLYIDRIFLQRKNKAFAELSNHSNIGDF